MTFRRLVLCLVFLFQSKVRAEQSVISDLVRLRPTAPPIVCNNGDLRVASNDSNALKICRANSWISFLDTGTGVVNPYSGTFSTVGVQAGSIQVTAASSFGNNVTASGNFIGNLVGNVTGALTGTASFAAASGTASFATASTTASVSGLADIAKISTAFATTPAGCSAGQYAHHIAPAGTFTCSQVAFSELSGTASIAQGGTNNGTLAVTAGGMFYSDGSKVMNMGAGTAGQAIRSSGSGTPSWRTITNTIQTFVSGSGVYTPSANALSIRVRMAGGGAGGLGSGTGAGSASATGGGDTTFGTTLVAGGGSLGVWGDIGGSGGTCSVTTPAVGVCFPGGQGEGAVGFAGGGDRGSGGQGGDTPYFGGGGKTGDFDSAAAAAAANSGGGGQGGGNNAAAGVLTGVGGGSGGYVEAWFYTLNATYSYSVGTAGTGGNAGTNGIAGASGAAGIIIIEEFY